MSSVLITIGIIVFAVFCFNFYKWERDKKRQNMFELSQLAEKLNEKLRFMTHGKTLATRVKNCYKSLDIIEEALKYPEAEEVITNIQDLKKRIPSIQKVLPVVDYLNKADKNRFKKKAKPELNNLLDALYEIKENNITDHHFRVADVKPDGESEEIRTIESIKKRAKKLGWEG